jgi:hypothetical protein
MFRQVNSGPSHQTRGSPLFPSNDGFFEGDLTTALSFSARAGYHLVDPNSCSEPVHMTMDGLAGGGRGACFPYHRKRVEGFFPI